MAVRLRVRGHRVTIVTANTEGAASEEVLDDIRVYRLPCWNLLSGTFPVLKPSVRLWRMLQRLRAERYSVISTQTRFFTTSLLGVIFARYNRIPYIHTERGSRHSVVRNPLVNWVSMAIDHTLGWWIVRGAKRVIGVSKAAQHFALHLGAKEAQVIPNGVNEEFLRTPLKRTVASSGGVHLLYIGRLIYAKGIQDLLQALANVRKGGQNLHLTIVGSGPYSQILQALAQQLRINDVVTFTGEQTREQIAQLIPRHDVFINPSYSEGLPTSVLEAAASGIAVIATDVGGTKEIVPSDRYGLLYTAGKVAELEGLILRYYEGTDERMQAAELLAVRTRKEFSWTSVVEKYEAEFAQVTHNS